MAIRTQTEWPVFDGHMDSLRDYFLHGRDAADFFTLTDADHLDYPRARAGGMIGGLFAIFTPPPGGRDRKGRRHQKQKPTQEDYLKWQVPIEPEFAMKMARNGIQAYKDLEAVSGGRFKMITEAAQFPPPLPSDCLHAVLHFEGAEPIAPDLSNLESYYEQGLRSIGLVWSRPNAFGQGVTLRFDSGGDQGAGLTEAGKELVRQCNRLGILLDVSHLNPAGFWDVAELTQAPFVASHSCVHALCPSPRNLTDEQLDAIARAGGLVGINFAVGFIRPDGELEPDTPLEDMVRHFRYIAERIGVDHLAVGSDFDGATIPNVIHDASGLPKLMQALSASGFSDEELTKIGCTNWFRVLGQVWR